MQIRYTIISILSRGRTSLVSRSNLVNYKVQGGWAWYEVLQSFLKIHETVIIDRVRNLTRYARASSLFFRFIDKNKGKKNIIQIPFKVYVNRVDEA